MICQTQGCKRPVREKNGVRGRLPLYCTLHATDRHPSRPWCKRCWTRIQKNGSTRICNQCKATISAERAACKKLCRQMLSDVRTHDRRARSVHTRDRVERILWDAGFLACEPYLDADHPWKIRCRKCMTIQHCAFGRLNGYACGACSGRGRNIRPHVIYLIASEPHDAVKVGVSADARKRLAIYPKSEWRVLGTWAFPDGRVAREAEGRVIEWWRGPCQLPWARRWPARLGGASETAPLSKCPVAMTMTVIHNAALDALA